MEVYQERARGTQLAQNGGDLDGDGRRTDAALRADHTHTSPCFGAGRCATMRWSALYSSSRVTGSATHSFTPARIASSRSAIEYRQDHQHTGRGMEPLDGANFPLNRASIPLIDDQDIGLPGSRLCQRGQPSAVIAMA
jgi:hypothetical protein